jgi:hypothetical protein
MPRQPADNCADCYCWTELEPEPTPQPQAIGQRPPADPAIREGQCRPSPPHPLHTSARRTRRVFWPITTHDDWCAGGTKRSSVVPDTPEDEPA